MKTGDRKKLEQALELLDSTDLGLSWVWMFTWGTVKYFMDDPEWKFKATEDEIWDAMVNAVANGYEFTLEYGADEHNEQVREWLLNNNFMVDIDHEEE